MLQEPARQDHLTLLAWRMAGWATRSPGSLRFYQRDEESPGDGGRGDIVGCPEPHPLPLQCLPGAKVCIHKHQPSKLTVCPEGRDESGSQLDSFIRPFSNRGLRDAGKGKLHWEYTTATSSPLTAKPSLLSLDSGPAGGGGGEEMGKHQTRPFHQ